MSGPTCGHRNTAAVCETCKIERLEAKLEVAMQALEKLATPPKQGVSPAFDLEVKPVRDYHLKVAGDALRELSNLSAEKATSGPGKECTCETPPTMEEIDAMLPRGEPAVREFREANRARCPIHTLSGPGCDPVCKCLKGSGITEIDCDVHGIDDKKNAHIERLAAEKVEQTPCADSESEWKPSGRVLVDAEELDEWKRHGRGALKLLRRRRAISRKLAAKHDRLLEALLYLSEAGPGSIARHYREKIQAALAGAEPQTTEAYIPLGSGVEMGGE